MNFRMRNGAKMNEELYLLPVRNTYSPFKFGGSRRNGHIAQTMDGWMDGWTGGPHGQSRSNVGLDFGVEQATMESESFLYPYSPVSPTIRSAALYSNSRG